MVLRGHRSIVNQVRYNKSSALIISSGVEKIIKATWLLLTYPFRLIVFAVWLREMFCKATTKNGFKNTQWLCLIAFLRDVICILLKLLENVFLDCLLDWTCTVL